MRRRALAAAALASIASLALSLTAALASGAGTNIGNAAVLTGSASGTLSGPNSDDWYVIYPASTGSPPTVSVQNTTATTATCPSLAAFVMNTDGATLRSATLPAKTTQDLSPSGSSDRYFVELRDDDCASTGQTTYTVTVGGGGGTPLAGSPQPDSPGTSIGTAGGPLEAGVAYENTLANADQQDWLAFDVNGTAPVTVRVSDTTNYEATPAGYCTSVANEVTTADGSVVDSSTLGLGQARTYAISNPGEYFIALSDDDCTPALGGGAGYQVQLEPASGLSQPANPPTEPLQGGVSQSSAAPVSSGIAYTGTVADAAAQEWFATGYAGGSTQLVITVENDAIGTAPCSLLSVAIMQSDGAVVDSATLGEDQGRSFAFATAGTYYVEITDDGCNPGPVSQDQDPAYRLEVTGGQPPPATGPTGPTGSSTPTGPTGSTGPPPQQSCPAGALAACGRVYVALGDSYSSGEGVGAYFAGTATRADHCHRSERSYPALVAEQQGFSPFSGLPGDQQQFAACSGAVISDFTLRNHSNAGEDPQQEHLADAAGGEAKIALVTLSFGGNDLKFAPVVKQCIAHGLAVRLRTAGRGLFRRLLGRLSGQLRRRIDEAASTSCEQANRETVAAKIRGIAARLAGLYGQIASDAPNARVLVLGYPDFFPARIAGAWCDGVIEASDAEWVHGVIADFDDAIAGAVRVSGHSNVAYVAPLASWSGHDICSPASRSWFIKPSVAGAILKTAVSSLGKKRRFGRYFDDLEDLLRLEPALSTALYFHPSARGQAELAKAVEQALG